MSTATEDDRPNVLVIYADDTDRELLGCYDGEGLSPTIDRLASEGIRFDRYYSASPLCAPSRYCALTGQYATRSESIQREYPPGGPVCLTNYRPYIYEESEHHNLASELSAHGYTTGMVGKWHQGVAETLDEDEIDADGRDPDVARALEENYRTILESVRSTGFDYAASVYYTNPKQLDVPPDLRGDHNMEWITQGALEFLDRYGRDDDPFFLWMAPTCTHGPFGEEQLDADPRGTPAGYLDEAPDVQPSRESVIERVREADANAWGRGPLLTWMDDGIGAVLERLESLGVAEDTLVIFAADHGDLRGKGSVYDSGGHLPFVVRWPAEIDPGRPCTRFVQNIDIAPTIYDLLDVEPDHDHPIDGRSIVPLLTGEGEYERESLYQEIGSQRAVITDDRFHYVATRFPDEIQSEIDRGTRYSHHWNELDDPGDTIWDTDVDFPAYFDEDQLYDLEADPDERHTLAGDRRYDDKLTELRRLLESYSSDLPHEFGEFTSGGD